MRIHDLDAAIKEFALARREVKDQMASHSAQGVLTQNDKMLAWPRYTKAETELWAAINERAREIGL